MRIVFSGGGTGGHVFPAIAIADAVMKKEPDAQILFVGANGKIEMEKVPKAGYDIEGLWISGFHRKLTLRNLLFPIKLMVSLIKANRILRKFRPHVVVGVGGYASGPILQVATMMNLPTLIHEQNSFPGITNRILAKKVDKICVAYENMTKYFSREKIVLTGNPVRQALLDNNLVKNNARAFFELDRNKETILIFGGSLGARSINEAVDFNFEKICEEESVQIIWQVGKLYFDNYKNSNTAKLPHVHILPFINRMDMAYTAADLVICRAGALTISELSILGKASILVPSPNVSEDHQTKNALALVSSDAVEMISDQEIKGDLFDKAYKLIRQKTRLESLELNIRKLKFENADDKIANQIFNLVNTTSG